MLQQSLARREVAAANTVLLTASTTVSAADNKREVAGANNVLTALRRTSVATRDMRYDSRTRVNRTCACVDSPRPQLYRNAIIWESERGLVLF